MANVGLFGNLGTFVVGHGTWELLGIVVSGTAGLRMGWAMVATGGRTRLGSLRATGPVLLRLVAGAFAMIGVAAVIEGLWSAGPASPAVKVVFGVVQLFIVVGWLGLGGRGQR